MPRSSHRWTAELQQQICAYIRAGGFAEVAAVAAGLPATVFGDWLRRGQEPTAREPYRGFAAAVAEAVAQARLRAELAVFKASPLNWLRYGPGKETAASPGWTTASKPYSATDRLSESEVTARLMDLCGDLLKALEAFPEARAVAARLLAARS
jgi:hypothetical protein